MAEAFPNGDSPAPAEAHENFAEKSTAEAREENEEASSGYVRGKHKSIDSSEYVLGQTKSAESSHMLGSVKSSNSNVVSQILDGRPKVMQWLDLNQRALTSNSQTEESGLELIETISLDYLKNNPYDLFLRAKFAVPDFESIAVTSDFLKPSLSVVHLNSDEPPTVLSEVNRYYSPVFMKKPGENKEYLAVHCVEDMSIHLWDVENKTSRVVYRMNTDQQDWINMCIVDERTVVHEAGNSYIILNTESEPWTLRRTMGVEFLAETTDMCYTQIDGTASLVLCSGYSGLVQAVEMVTGRVRWRIGKEEMGENFCPTGVSPDTSDNALLVADSRQHSLHQVEPNTGALIRSIDLRSHAIVFPSCVRTKGDYIYVLCYLYERKSVMYAIAKFIQPRSIRHQ